MDAKLKQFILDLMQGHNIMTVATIRPDGWPHATTVGYVNDGLTLYFGCGSDSQKITNLRHCDKVSVTIDEDQADWNQIQGLSLAARAEFVSEPQEIEHVGALMLKKFPQIAAMGISAEAMPMSFVKLRPNFISVLDYRQGFGHTELVTV